MRTFLAVAAILALAYVAFWALKRGEPAGPVDAFDPLDLDAARARACPGPRYDEDNRPDWPSSLTACKTDDDCVTVLIGCCRTAAVNKTEACRVDGGPGAACEAACPPENPPRCADGTCIIEPWRAPEPVVKRGQAFDCEGLFLQQVLSSESGLVAVVNDQVVREGDKVNNALVDKITPRSVAFTSGRQTCIRHPPK